MDDISYHMMMTFRITIACMQTWTWMAWHGY